MIEIFVAYCWYRTDDLLDGLVITSVAVRKTWIPAASAVDLSVNV
jgi:hypothetical protein